MISGCIAKRGLNRAPVRAGLNWYRAMFRYGVPPAKNVRILPTTLILWGKQDRFAVPEASEASLARCDNGQLVNYERATHWLQHEESDDVNRRIAARSSSHDTTAKVAGISLGFDWRSDSASGCTCNYPIESP